MTPARGPREDPGSERLLVLDPTDPRPQDARVGDLAGWLAPGDLLVVNDAATLPASLPARTHSGRPLEVRLAGGPGPTRYFAVLLGPGSWRTRTEDRPPPPRVLPGCQLTLGADGELTAEVRGVSARSPRWVELELRGGPDEVQAALYRAGLPVQYSYLSGEVPLERFQTPLASRPWAAEMPSAGRALTWRLLRGLREAGVELAWLTHAAGLSSTGDPDLDALLPMPEVSDIPAATVAAIARAQARGARVVAAGTTVVRALEGKASQGHARGGALAPGRGVTDLVLGPGTPLQVVDGLVTGIHDPSESHFRLLSAFAEPAVLEAAFRHAVARGYLGHEFGDSCLLLPGAVRRAALGPGYPVAA